MRLRRGHDIGSANAAAAERRGNRILADAALLGSWSATRWQYRSRANPESVVDVVCALGATVTLSLSEDSYVLTWSLADQRNRSLGGAFAVQGERLELRTPDQNPPEALTYRLAGETLALSSESSEWDFDGDGKDEAADFVAVLVRL